MLNAQLHCTQGRGGKVLVKWSGELLCVDLILNHRKCIICKFLQAFHQLLNYNGSMIIHKFELYFSLYLQFIKFIEKQVSKVLFIIIHPEYFS